MNNPYYIPGTDCLKNLLGIQDKSELAEVEDSVTSKRIAKLDKDPLPGKVNYDYLKAIHKNIFDGIYDWAGKERSFQTMKGNSRFEWPNKIVKSAEKLFSELEKENGLKGLSRSEFIEKATHYYAEINAVHPFPEGNGRSQKLLFDRIANDAGYEFRWNDVSKEQFIDAVIHGHEVDTSKLEKVFDMTLHSIERSVELERSNQFEFDIKDSISVAEYKKATALVSAEEKAIRGELFPENPTKQSLNEFQKTKILMELKKRIPEAQNTKTTFEAQKQVKTLLSELRAIDTDIKKARQGGDVALESRLSKKMDTRLKKLIYRKSLASNLSTTQLTNFQSQRSALGKSLDLSKSRGLER